jgi:hypothetical protein
MNGIGGRYILAGLCVLSFILAQTFQAFAYWFWIPNSHGPNALNNRAMIISDPVTSGRKWRPR